MRENQMPKCYQLIGVPGSGKSTWYANQEWMKDMMYVSTDIYVEKFARRMKKTYREVFNDVMPRAVRLMMRRVNIAKEKQQDIVWDQTSTTEISRARKFRSLIDYDHVAVVFPTPDLKELERRLVSRVEKDIPRDVVWNMIVNFEEPSEEEGFKEIWRT